MDLKDCKGCKILCVVDVQHSTQVLGQQWIGRVTSYPVAWYKLGCLDTILNFLIYGLFHISKPLTSKCVCLI